MINHNGEEKRKNVYITKSHCFAGEITQHCKSGMIQQNRERETLIVFRGELVKETTTLSLALFGAKKYQVFLFH